MHNSIYRSFRSQDSQGSHFTRSTLKNLYKLFSLIPPLVRKGMCTHNVENSIFRQEETMSHLFTKLLSISAYRACFYRDAFFEKIQLIWYMKYIQLFTILYRQKLIQSLSPTPIFQYALHTTTKVHGTLNSRNQLLRLKNSKSRAARDSLGLSDCTEIVHVKVQSQ